MNLHNIVAGAIANVNPFIDGWLSKNEGYTVNQDYSRTPSITTYPAKLQVQAATEDMLKFASSQSIQGTLRSVYLYGNWTASQRPDQFGGDIVKFDNKEWLIIQVLEHWPDWTHVLVVLQGNNTGASSAGSNVTVSAPIAFGTPQSGNP